MSDLRESCEHDYRVWKVIGDWSLFACKDCGALATKKDDDSDA